MIPDGASTSQPAVDKDSHEDLLTEARIHALLHERGYKLIERFQHIHVCRGRHEWHVCLLADLPRLTLEQFQQRVEEALSFRSASS
jgi:hypothetical protein